MSDRPLDLALRYMDIFFAGEGFSELRQVLVPDLSFTGPFFSFDSAEAYIASLEADPPVDCAYELLGAFEGESAACLICRFTKPGVSTPMAQLFEVADGRIRKTLLGSTAGRSQANRDYFVK